MYYAEINENAAPGIQPNRYYINIYGDIYSTVSNKFLKKTFNGEYFVVSLSLQKNISKTFLIHRLIMMTYCYINNCNNLHVNHLDGNKYNDCIYNLEWTTNSGNHEHAMENNLFCYGENVKQSILNEKQVHEICNLLANKKYTSITEIAHKYECSCATIGDIARGIAWKNISMQYNLDYDQRERFTDNQVHQICLIFANNKGKSFQYIYYLTIYFMGFPDNSKIRKRIYKLYNRDPNNYLYITSQYDY